MVKLFDGHYNRPIVVGYKSLTKKVNFLELIIIDRRCSVIMTKYGGQFLEHIKTDRLVIGYMCGSGLDQYAALVCKTDQHN